MPGPSSSCVPWSSTPPGATAPRPLSVRSPSSSGDLKPWTPGNLSISWLHNPRPTCSRTYASPSRLPFPAQGSLPARAGSPLAGRVSHPLDDKQGFMKSSHTPLLLDQPCLVALDVRLRVYSLYGGTSDERADEKQGNECRPLHELLLPMLPCISWIVTDVKHLRERVAVRIRIVAQGSAPEIVARGSDGRRLGILGVRACSSSLPHVVLIGVNGFRSATSSGPIN